MRGVHKMKKMYIILLSLFILMSMSCAFASDNITINNNSANVHVDTAEPITIDGNNHVDNTTEPIINENTTTGSYDDLKHEIENLHPNDTFNFMKDYSFSGFGFSDRAIVIKQNDIIINGNGHTIDAGRNDHFAIFNILGANVKINNLTFTNSYSFTNSYPTPLRYPTLYNTQHVPISSPITWNGDNGVMQNCIFSHNIALNGGSLTWKGDNGKIDNCSFVNSTASGIGGSIYLGGINNTISNCTFYNSKSLLNESIYLDRNRKNITLENNTFFIGKNDFLVIDGAGSNIDVGFLEYRHYAYVDGNMTDEKGTAHKYNIVPLLFKAIVAGGTIDNGNFKYNVIYNNITGDFTFNTFSRKEAKGSLSGTPDCDFEYLKSIHIKSNITDLNQVFLELFHENYDFNIGQLVTGYVSNAQDYEFFKEYKSNGLWFKHDKEDSKFANLTTGLRIIFKEKLKINSASTWNSNGFNSITIIGNGSTINGGAKNTEEKKWFKLDDSRAMVTVNDLTIEYFNTAIECVKGTYYLNNVHLNTNHMDYTVDRDWGAGILNTGAVFCNNCTFAYNYAKNGAAVFNQGYLSLDNCTFIENHAYGKGNHVCVGDGGIVVVNGKNITKNTADSIIYFAESMSTKNTILTGGGAIVLSFLAGFAAGFFSANPAVGISVGVAVGAGLGTGASCYINSRHYDIHYNRGLTCLFVIGGSVLAGAAGGYLGALARAAISSSASIVNTETSFKDPRIIDSSEVSSAKVVSESPLNSMTSNYDVNTYMKMIVLGHSG